MKALIIPIAAALLLSSCSTYQMNMLSSSNTNKDEQTGKFNMENDSVKISYSFYGQNAPIHIDVFNKLNEPLYIDWQRSAFIVDNKATSYADKEVRIAGETSTVGVGGRNLNFSSGTVNAIASLPENVVFIPPHAQVGKTTAGIASQIFNDIPDDAFVKKSLPTTTPEQPANAKVAEFTKENSPAYFKSYITLYTLQNNSPKYISFEHQFYVSKIIRSGSSPESFEFYQGGRGDYFYTSKTTTYGKVSAGAVVVAALVGAAALDASTKKN